MKILLINPMVAFDDFFTLLAQALATKHQVELVHVQDWQRVYSPGLVKRVPLDPKLIDEWIDYDYQVLPHFPGLYQELQEFARYRYYKLHQHFQQHSYDLVILWNGQRIVNQIVTYLARRVNIPVIFMENGPLPRTTQVDLGGINAASQFWQHYQPNIAKPANEVYLQQRIDQLYQSAPARLRTQPVPRPRYLSTQNLARILQRPSLSLAYPAIKLATYYQDRTDYRSQQKLHKHLTASGCSTWQPFILLALQVHDDTQIIINSPYIKSMPNLIKLAHQAAQAATGSTYTLVIKEHPADFGRINYQALKSLPHTQWLIKADVRQLINQSALIITVNSSLAVEALARYKPVITLGQAYFNIPGLVHHTHPNYLTDTIKLVLSQPINRPLVNRFLTDLMDDYLVPVCWSSPEPTGIQQLAQRIEKLANSARTREPKRISTVINV